MALTDAEFILLDGRSEASGARVMTVAEVADLFGYHRPVAASPRPAEVIALPVANSARRPQPAAGGIQRWTRRATAGLLVASLVTGWAVLALAVAQHVFGFETLAVLTGSMRPRIPVGALVVEHKVPATEIKVGDVISFHPSTDRSMVISHRVIQIRTRAVNDVNQTYFVTKGDANPVPDPGGVPAVGDIGRVDATYPYVGYATAFLQRPDVRAALLVLPLVLMVSVVMSYLWPERKPR
jgi:signal peptidase